MSVHLWLVAMVAFHGLSLFFQTLDHYMLFQHSKVCLCVCVCARAWVLCVDTTKPPTILKRDP